VVGLHGSVRLWACASCGAVSVTGLRDGQSCPKPSANHVARARTIGIVCFGQRGAAGPRVTLAQNICLAGSAHRKISATVMCGAQPALCRRQARCRQNEPWARLTLLRALFERVDHAFTWRRAGDVGGATRSVRKTAPTKGRARRRLPNHERPLGLYGPVNPEALDRFPRNGWLFFLLFFFCCITSR